MATKVKLREKAITGNRKSLYLDFYPAILNPETGEPTRREFLGLYIYNNAKSTIDKQHNKETIEIAEQIRQKRENRINKPEIYSGYEAEQLKIKEKGQQNFVEYFSKLADKRKASNYDNWISAYYYLNEYTNGQLKFSDLNETFCNEFKDYLLSTKSRKSDKVTLSINSAVSYFNKVKAAMKQAFKDGIIQIDFNAKIEPIKTAETQRGFLTIEGLNKLVKVDCKHPIIKRAALFSALTGLRFSDIQNLVWGDIEFIEGNGYFLKFIQQKTKGVEMMPISEQAFEILGEQKERKDKVFEGLNYSIQCKSILKWVEAAGINKKITFHCFRHTFATLQLSKGTDIYTVSKMLGHRELKTTQIYAKVMDEAKRTAADKIKLEF